MGKKNKRQKTKEVSSVVETEEKGVNASSPGRAGDEVGENYPLIAPRKRGRPRKIAAEKGEEEDDDGETGGVGKKYEQQLKEEDSIRSRARRKSTPRKSS